MWPGKQWILSEQEATMAQFRVVFVLDVPSGKYLAELYSPAEGVGGREALVARTAPLYASQEAAMLGVVELFRQAMSGPGAESPGKRRRPSAARRSPPKAPRRRASPSHPASRKAARRRPAPRSAPRRASSAPKGRTSRAKARRRRR